MHQTILRAMSQPDRYLAAALGELPDEVLAARIGAMQNEVYQLRLMGWPRAGDWDHDVKEMAMTIGAHPGWLADLLKALGPR